MWQGARAALVVELRAADGTRLVDEALSVATTNGAPILETAWDLRVLEAGVGAAGIALSIEAGDLDGPVELVVAATSQLEAVRARELFGGPILAGRTQLICFDAPWGGTDVVFVPWTFTGEGADSLSPDLIAGRNCTHVYRETPGRADVTGTAPGGLTVTVRVEFVAPTSERQLTSAAPEAAGPSLGERAGG